MTKAEIRTNKGPIIIEFFEQSTPNTVKNFVVLAKSHFYDGVTFHRVIPGFVVQGGDPDGTGRGGPGYTIPDEFNNNKQKHTLGAISMANTGQPNSNGSQFFMVLNPDNCKHLDNKHTVFGHVIEGMEVITKIEQGDKMLEINIIEESDFIKNHQLTRF